VSVIDATYGESAHRWPHFLPDGRHFLYTGVVGTCCPASKPARVKIGVLDAPDTVTLFDVESAAAYAAGHLLFNRNGTLMAQPFDPGSRQLTGDSFPLADDVDSEGSRYASFSASDSVLVYVRSGAQETRQLTWLDREGKTLSTIGERATYVSPHLSPDGRNVAVEMASGTPPNPEIWVLSPDGKQTRLTSTRKATTRLSGRRMASGSRFKETGRAHPRCARDS
jgi:eukaryotic-like serine/threonine-protein kinase